MSRVWKALTDYREFGTWFRVRLESPFVPGKSAGGQITHPGFEHVRMEVVVQKMQPERLFSFTWHPYAVEPDVDYSKETPTLVEFTLEPIAERHAAARRRERLRQDSGTSPRRGLPHERGRLGSADGKYRAPCPTSGLASSPR